MENGWKPEVEISPNCPRCGSSNTKFCYYNNYSLTQPRYFCKGCRRYWTKGGSLRNVPIGGGCRKNRRANKTLRQSSSLDCLTFKNNSHQIGHSYDPTIRNNSSSSCSSSMVNDGGPNIDLALVYANFLNQKQDTSNQDHASSQTGFDPSLENSSALNLPQQASSEPYFRSDDNNHNSSQICYGDFNSMIQKERIEQCSSINHDAMNFELPPLPGEDELASSHDLMWPNSSEMLMNHAFQPPLLGPEPHDPDLLIGNWSPFDLPRDSSFSKP